MEREILSLEYRRMFKLSIIRILISFFRWTSIISSFKYGNVCLKKRYVFRRIFDNIALVDAFTNFVFETICSIVKKKKKRNRR